MSGSPKTKPAGADELLVVGRLGRAHGVRGDLTVDVRTDVPDERFRAGAVLRTDPPERGPLTVASARTHSGRFLIRFVGVDDRNAAEELSGTTLVIPMSEAGSAGREGWWDDDLIGLRVEGRDGAPVGTVADVLHAPAQDLLAITLPDGRQALLPFVELFVPEVDVAGGRVVVAPPGGWDDL